MLPLSAELIALERQKQLLSEAEEFRLIRMARPLRKKPGTFRRMVAVAGDYMVRLGSRMQTYGTLSAPESRSIPMLAASPDQRRYER